MPRTNALAGVLVAIFAGSALAINFPFESVQLTDAEASAFPAIAFGNPDGVGRAPRCKAWPGIASWPADEEWTRLNNSLGDGALLHPQPAEGACYRLGEAAHFDAKECEFLHRDALSSRFYIDDPLTVQTTWPQGDTCFLPGNETDSDARTCTRGGYPFYVVNATTVRQIQIAVNFARNTHVRLVIKNTGHDFSGRSTGAGALSIWTHHLKSFGFLPEYAQGQYRGMAARVSAGIEAWELYRYMEQHNMFMLAPGGATVGVYGGFMAGGGHSLISSLYGLGADQPLSLEVVTADGRLVTADPETNSDLFYALRGGGPSTYGIVISAVVKAYPYVNMTRTPLTFQLKASSASNSHTKRADVPTVNDKEVFWAGINAYYKFGPKVLDKKGNLYDYLQSAAYDPAKPDFTTFATTIGFPNTPAEEAYALLEPLFTELRSLSIPVGLPQPVTSGPWSVTGPSRDGKAQVPNATPRFASRLFPRRNWEDDALFNKTMRALRHVVEDGGYRSHGVMVAPTVEAAGYPGDSAVHPAWRHTVMHNDLFDVAAKPGSQSAAEFRAAHARLRSYVAPIIEATDVGGGSYIAESDVEEPEWQEAFFGSTYGRLLEIKRKRDPWGLFWAPRTVGSEGWEVRTGDGLATQDGSLCRVGACGKP